MNMFSTGCQEYHQSRRAFLGTAAFGTFLGMNLRSLVARAGQDHKPTAEQVILFWNSGGMSHIDFWDPKPGRPSAGEFKPISTAVPGIQLSELLPQTAKAMKHIALLRSLHGKNGAHARATYEVQTGYNQTANLQHPGLGSIVVSERKQMGDLPAYISIGGGAPRAGYLGQKCEAYYVGRAGEKDPYLSFPTSIGEVRGNKRLEILDRMNQRNSPIAGTDDAVSTQTAIGEAVKLMRSPALEAFEVSKEKPEVIERYGANPYGKSVVLARRLIEKGVRFVQVNKGGWDTHFKAFPALQKHGESTDPAVAALIEDLAQSGLLKKTLVVMLSEFGRTPKINTSGGRDHYPAVFTAMLAGGGIRGGQVVGSSDEDGAFPKDRPANIQDLHATICYALGIDPNKEVMTPLQRPMKLVDNGKPVMELFTG